MPTLQRILRQLKAQRAAAQVEVDRLNRAIEALTGGRRGPGRPSGRKRRSPGRPPAKKRRLSAASRKKISAAQRARWAKIKARKKAPKRKRKPKSKGPAQPTVKAPPAAAKTA